MRCPACRAPLDPGAGVCAAGHSFQVEGGVLRLLAGESGRQIRAFAAITSAIRVAQGRGLDPALFPRLPDAPELAGDHEWRLRRHDLALTTRLLGGRGPLRVLDVGAWNGWLSNRLAAQGHRVTAADYFDDERDGLGARRFYGAPGWRAVQCDLSDLPILGRYDAVILNRCLQFAGDPAAFAALALGCVAPGGLLIATGLQLFRDPRRKAREVAELRRLHRARYGVELFLRPTKGYLDLGDGAALRRLGMSLRPYPQLWAANARALLDWGRPLHYYGVQWIGSRDGRRMGSVYAA